MINIVILTPGFLPIPAAKGGAVENLIENILKENEKYKRFNFEILSPYDNEAIIYSKDYKNSKFIFIKTNLIIKTLDKIIFWVAKNIIHKNNSYSYRHILQRIFYLRKCSRILQRGNYDKVILENHPTEYFALKWKNNYIKYKGKYYYHCHNEFPSTYGCIDIIKNTKKIICVSKYRKENVKKFLNMPEYKFDVLRNGIDSNLFKKELTIEEKNEIRKKYNIGVNDKVLIYTGRVIPGKGILETISALKKINNKNIRLLIVGASLNKLGGKTEFEQEIESIIDDRIIFTGYIDYNQIYKLYKIADIALLPSTIEDSAPLTIIEALVSGIPIITTNSGGIPEYAIDNSAIILERNKDLVDSLAKSIKELLNNPSKLNYMSKKAINVSKELTKERFFEEFCNIIK